MTSATWPETPAERQARKGQVRVQKRKQTARKAVAEIDTRTPSGKTLPY